ncbi:MAG: glycosyltransferase [Mycobacterium sp.]|uniref:glycosyltransferase n=1 Tax=Mycobacterium sp. TaxID=1785 RepID=UPI001ECF2397|nr:glycosyltransferase [Mycobacterium sp.]MBW0019922.1 glycosyltransferase [Mycobacterium sp.]
MKSALRIALIASSRFPISQPFAGGLEAHVWHLARGLTAYGHEVSVFAAPGSDRDLDCHTLPVRPLAMSDAARGDVSMPPDAFMADHHAYLALMLQLAGASRDDFHIIHNHSLHYLPVAMARMLPTPMLTSVHTPPTPWLESAIDASGGAGTQFAAVSAHTAAAWGKALGHIAVVPNGIATDRWPLGPGGGPLVWFGRITPEKAPHLAIAAARLARRPLVLAGPIADQRYFTAEVAPNLDEEIRYVGHLNHNELARLVGGSAAALITPVWDEPYGLVVAEAMCCGTPVVAFACGGIPELLAPQAGRLVPAKDTSAMADAIAEVVRMPRDQVRDHAVRHCSLEAMLAAYINLYRQIIDNRSEVRHDRLLRTPSRLRTSGAGDQHRRRNVSADDGADFVGHPTAAPLYGGRETTA